MILIFAETPEQFKDYVKARKLSLDFVKQIKCQNNLKGLRGVVQIHYLPNWNNNPRLAMAQKFILEMKPEWHPLCSNIPQW